jgi:hypothetical protein
MQEMVKTSLTAVVAIVCLVALLSLQSAAQEEKDVNGVYQAQVMGQGIQFGKTFRISASHRFLVVA